MENCDILNQIKSFDIEKQRSFTLDDFESCKYAKNQIETYIRLGILKKNKDGSYMIKNMCMLSQF